MSLRSAARSDVGSVRSHNEDSAYVGPRVLAVADGMGGHACGELASATTIDCLAALDRSCPGPNLVNELESKVAEANDRLRALIEKDPNLQGMGTTLTAMLWDERDRLALIHVGDSRAYLLRDGLLRQITNDHTFVQSLVDAGRISLEEAAIHPQRSMVTRALHGMPELDADLSLWESRPGDRYLLCSDGISAVVSDETLQEILQSVTDPEEAVERLIDLANRGGGPDNITCVVADIVLGAVSQRPIRVVGAAAEQMAQRHVPATDRRTEEVFGPPPPMGDGAPAPDDHARPARGRRLVVLSLLLLFPVVLGLGWYWL
ncbi:PP2C family serine/threonine-protein phosphatase [Streptomyces diacarni]|uniref:PP2C family protein-serine/threonine phosphatase n=1 Tax=Streptomyces diacarni TaxID=2800381 RepID=UPI0033E0DEA0